MKESRAYKIRRFWKVLWVGFLITGCTSVWEFPVTQVQYSAHDKINYKVVLWISEELEHANWEAMISPFDRARIPLGSSLSSNSESLARAVFSDVQVIHNQTIKPSGVAVLIPKLVSVERTHPTTVFGQQTTTLIISWTLINSNGEVVWADTIKGDATTEMGIIPKQSARVQLDAAIKALFEKSFMRMRASQELKDLAIKK